MSEKILLPRRKSLLNGVWMLQPTNDDALPSSWSHTVPVPALVNSAEPRHDWKAFKYHWHRTTFEVAKKSDLAFIVIEQAMFSTDIWLNGTHLGGDIACYTSQEYDVRKVVAVGVNELIVRVGQREHLPPESAVGKDQERTDWIPGIWGDVYLLQCSNPRVRHVQVIPHLDSETAEVRVTIQNLGGERAELSLISTVRERKSGQISAEQIDKVLTIPAHSEQEFIVHHTLRDMQVWSPDNPFLYEVETNLKAGGKTLGSQPATFGMREFRIEGRHFLLNGKRILLRGGNIAFHRFLSDPQRETLPWNLDWVKRLLIDIPKEHNFNFFRNHIGQMYNRWYDIADEHGMLLQNEWMFWTTTGTKEQIAKEFTCWLQDNWNHPCIIMWDALNECSNDVVQKEIVPELKTLDPTRPWESVDFVEEHPYIYSLGPVLNDRKLGFTRSLDEIEHSTTPTMLNEFCWWWLDKDFNPSLLTKDVVERWLGPSWTKEQLIAHQSFLVTELVELFRRMKVDAIQPFVYLSNNTGPTANWFSGDIKELQAKPILAALKNAFAPFGVSIELWDRHFFPGEHRRVRVFVFNDRPVSRAGSLRCGVVNAKGEWIVETVQSVHAEPSCTTMMSLTMPMPSLTGEYRMRSELLCDGVVSSLSEKIVHVVSVPEASPRLREASVALLSSTNELKTFLVEKGIDVTHLKDGNLRDCSLLIVGEGMLNSSEYQSRLGAVTHFLEEGKSVIVLEPEFGIDDQETMSVALGVDLQIEKRNELDKGGYDSYVFADDISHPIWNAISPEHLKMFNGAYGGEMVSEYSVTTNVPHTILARCGLKLAVSALIEIPVGNGRVLISRIQTRGRLVGGDVRDSFARRKDPVAQRFFLNVLSYGVA